MSAALERTREDLEIQQARLQALEQLGDRFGSVCHENDRETGHKRRVSVRHP